MPSLQRHTHKAAHDWKKTKLALSPTLRRTLEKQLNDAWSIEYCNGIVFLCSLTPSSPFTSSLHRLFRLPLSSSPATPLPSYLPSLSFPSWRYPFLFLPFPPFLLFFIVSPLSHFLSLPLISFPHSLTHGNTASSLFPLLSSRRASSSFLIPPLPSPRPFSPQRKSLEAFIKRGGSCRTPFLFFFSSLKYFHFPLYIPT